MTIKTMQSPIYAQELLSRRLLYGKSNDILIYDSSNQHLDWTKMTHKYGTNLQKEVEIQIASLKELASNLKHKSNNQQQNLKAVVSKYVGLNDLDVLVYPNIILETAATCIVIAKHVIQMMIRDDDKRINDLNNIYTMPDADIITKAREGIFVSLKLELNSVNSYR